MAKLMLLPDFNKKIMIQKYILLSIFFTQSVFMAAQVGINNQNPEATLDVSGDVRVREKLFLQDPGIYTNASNSELLMIKDSNNEIIKYNIVDSEYGPLNYVQFVFENTSDNGLKEGYNTKINATK